MSCTETGELSFDFIQIFIQFLMLIDQFRQLVFRQPDSFCFQFNGSRIDCNEITLSAFSGDYLSMIFVLLVLVETLFRTIEELDDPAVIFQFVD